MNIRTIQTGWVKIKSRQVVGKGSDATRLINTLLDTTWTGWLPIYAWLIEHPDGLILIDTGDVHRPDKHGRVQSLHPYYRWNAHFNIAPEEEIGPQLEKLGFATDDVRWVILTHLHIDHAGGIGYFPNAEILISQQEYDLTKGIMAWINGYTQVPLPAWFDPTIVTLDDTPLESFPQSYKLLDDVYLVPSYGHSPGQLSVILQTDTVDYLFGADTSYTQEAMITLTVDGVSPSERVVKETLQRTYDYTQARPTVYLASHDPESGQRLANREIVAMDNTPILA